MHLEAALDVPLKKCDYFSTSGELIFKKYAKKQEKGFYGLPTSLEVAQDLIVQMPSNEMLQAMEIEQYFFEDDAPLHSQAINGHQINIYLKNSYIQSCKLIYSSCSFADIRELSGKIFTNKTSDEKQIGTTLNVEISPLFEKIES